MTLSARAAGVWTGVAIAACLGMALAWPFTHSIAVRNVLGHAALVLLLVLSWRAGGQRLNGPIGLLRAWRAVFWLLAMLSIWLLVQGLVVSPDQKHFLHEYRGEWLRGLTMLLLGVWLTLVIKAYPQRWDAGRVLLWILLAMMAVVLGHVLDAIYLALRDGAVHWQETRIVRKRTILSLHVNVLFGFWCAEIVTRAIAGRRFLPLSNSMLAVVTGLCIVATLSILTSNGTATALIIATLSLVVVAMTWLKGARRQAVGKVAISLALVVVLLAGLSWHLDKRSRLFAESMSIALDTTHNLAWLNQARYPWPKLADGRPVETSAYLRVAWFKVGTELVAKQPLGYGMNREVFDNLLRTHYHEPDPFPSHTHSGLLDFTLEGGVPALLLWLAFVGTVLSAAIRAYKQRREPAALMMIFLIVGFVLRSIVDINMRDHTLEQFLFLVGFLAPLVKDSAARAAGQPMDDARST
jgi:hypothetical protein